MVDARTLLGMPVLRLTARVAGDAGNDLLTRPISRVYSTELPDPSRYLSGGELVISGLLWWRGPDDAETFVRALAAHDVAALAASAADTGGVLPESLRAACARHGVGLVEAPPDLSFAVITEYVVLALAAERDETVLATHRRLLAAAAGDGGLAGLLRSGAGELGVAVAVRAATGRVLASSAPGAGRGGVTVTVPEHAARALVGWSLVIDVDERTWRGWPRGRRAVAEEIAAMTGLLRTRSEQSRRARDEAGRGLLTALAGGRASREDLEKHLAAAGVPSRAPLRMLAARTEGAPPGFTAALLDETLAELGTSGPVHTAADAVYALAEAGASWPPDAAARIRAVMDAAAPWRQGCRAVVAFSGPANLDGLRGAVEEARHALALGPQRLAAERGRGAVIAGDEIAAHRLLLATAPDDLRHTLRRRLLGALEDYDRDHRGALLETLRVYLERSCSPSATAEAMHVHVNTVRYRVGRVEQLLGTSLTSFPDRVDLYLALHIATPG